MEVYYVHMIELNILRFYLLLDSIAKILYFLNF